MKRFLILILLGLFIAGCEPPGFYDRALGQTLTPVVTPSLEGEQQRAVEVRWSINASIYQMGLEAGSKADIDLTFSPSILHVTRRADGSISQTTSGDWQEHPVGQMRYCVSVDQPCASLGKMRPFEPEITTGMQLDWLGVRQVYLSAEFFDRDGKSVPATNGWDLNTLSSGILVMDQTVTTVLNPDTPVENLPSPVITAVAATSIAFPVTGSVKIEGSPCCRGGTAGSKIKLKVNFLANSPAGKVTEMRVGRMCSTSPADMAADWEPFALDQTIETTVPLNWTTFSISVQYRDAQGNFSKVYCDSLGLEGSPVQPTQKP